MTSDTGDASGTQQGSLGTGGTSSAGSVFATSPALDPDLEKTLRGHDRPPADLVWRRMSTTDARLRGFDNVDWPPRVEESLLSLPVGGVFWPDLKARIVAMEFLRDWMAEVLAVRRAPCGRYLSLGSSVKTSRDSTDDDGLMLVGSFDSMGMSRTLTVWPGSIGQ